MKKSIEIIVRENGPYLIAVSSGATFTDAAGQTHAIEGSMVALCRCGHSGNKPFCDGTHKKVNFEAPGGKVTLSAAE